MTLTIYTITDVKGHYVQQVQFPSMPYFNINKIYCGLIIVEFNDEVTKNNYLLKYSLFSIIDNRCKYKRQITESFTYMSMKR